MRFASGSGKEVDGKKFAVKRRASAYDYVIMIA